MEPPWRISLQWPHYGCGIIILYDSGKWSRRPRIALATFHLQGGRSTDWATSALKLELNASLELATFSLPWRCSTRWASSAGYKCLKVFLFLILDIVVKDTPYFFDMSVYVMPLLLLRMAKTSSSFNVEGGEAASAFPLWAALFYLHILYNRIHHTARISWSS